MNYRFAGMGLSGLSVNSIIALSVLTVSSTAHSFPYKGTDIRLKAQAGETYDDNITFLKDDPRKDTITRLTAGLGIDADFQTRLIQLGGSFTRQIFSRNPGFDNTSGEANFHFLNEFSARSRLSIRDAFSHAHEPRSFEETLGRTGGRFSYSRNRLGIEYARDLNSAVGLRARYGNEIDDFSREDLRDSYLNTGGGSLNYSFSSAFSVLASYDYTVRKYDPGPDAKTHTVSATAKRSLTPQTYVELKGGVDAIRDFNGREFTKPLVYGALTSEADDRTQTVLSFEKRYYTNPFIQDLFNFWQATGRLARRFAERMGGSVSGFYGEGEYVSISIRDTLLGAQAGLWYDFTEHFKGNLAYTLSNVRSNVRSREYLKNTYFVGLSAEF